MTQSEIEADYWTVRGLEFTGSPSHAYVCVSCRGNVFQRLSMHDNVRSGLTLRDRGTMDSQVLTGDSGVGAAMGR